MPNGTEEQASDNAVFTGENDLVIRSLMPGILVGTKFRKIGGRKTRRQNERTEIIENKDGTTSATKTWDAIQECENIEEDQAAEDLRKEIVNALSRLGIKTTPGLVVLMDNKRDLFTTLLHYRRKVASFNEEAETVNLIFDFELHKSEAENKLAIAALNQQLDEILGQINMATKLDDQAILEKARGKELVVELLGKETTLTIQQVLNGSADQRREVVAKIRARLAREAISEAKNFKDRLPEEAGFAVTNLIDDIRVKARAWVKASKQSDEAYKEALEAVDNDGISDMQAALVMAAARANQEVDQAMEEIVENDGDSSVLIGGETAGSQINLLDGVEDEEGFDSPDDNTFGPMPFLDTDNDTDGDDTADAAAIGG
jgi:hypothetical protein